MATKTRSAHQKQLYASYKAQNRWEINKRKKIARHLKKYPNDTCATEALKRGFKYSRQNPKSQIWSHSDKAAAKLFTEFGRSGHEVILLKKARAQGARKAADE